MDIVKLEYDAKANQMRKYVEDIHSIILSCVVPLEGNCFYHHNTLSLYPELYSKQVNLVWCGKHAKTHICEIGFNAGHSTMLMLLGRDATPLDFTIFDIGHHAYTRPCLEYIKKEFGHVKFEYIEGDSTQTMKSWISAHPDSVGIYDVVHVDGGHSEHCIRNDMINADKLVRAGGIIIVDDTNSETINKYVNLYIQIGNYQEVQLLPSVGYPHRVICKIN